MSFEVKILKNWKKKIKKIKAFFVKTIYFNYRKYNLFYWLYYAVLLNLEAMLDIDLRALIISNWI